MSSNSPRRMRQRCRKDRFGVSVAAALLTALAASLTAASSAPAETVSSHTATAALCDETLTPFEDVEAGHFAVKDISCMHSLGVINGTSAKRFSPSAGVSRAEMATMLVRLWRALGKECPVKHGIPFTDVPTDHWARAEITCLHGLGLIKGTSTTKFSPDGRLTRAQIAAMSARLWRELGKACSATERTPFNDVPADHWAAADIACLHSLGALAWLSGAAFDPGKEATRAETAAVLAGLWRAQRAESPASSDRTQGAGGTGAGEQQHRGAQQTPAGTPGSVGGGQQRQGDSLTPAQQQSDPTAPSVLTVRTADRGLAVAWQPPSQPTADVVAYQVWHCTSAPSSCASPKITVATDTDSSPSATISNLTVRASYHVRVRAQYNSSVSGWSNTATGTVLGSPSAVNEPTVRGGKAGNTLIGSNNLRVWWSAPDDNGSSITGYQLRYSANGFTWTSWANTVTTTTATITGLTNGTAYFVQVRGVNNVGPGAWSPSAVAVPSALPSAPAAPVVSLPTPTNDGTTLAVSWTPPASNGATITGYNLRFSTDGTTWTVAVGDVTRTTATLAGLTNGTSHQVSVRAVNSNGRSGWSPSSSGTPSMEPSAPSAPTLVVGVGVINNVAIGSGKIRVSWTAPSDGGAAITDYDVRYRTGSGKWKHWPHTGTSTTTTIAWLDNGVSYQVQVRASNSVGAGAWSSSATASPASVPIARLRPFVHGGKYRDTIIGDGALRVWWPEHSSWCIFPECGLFNRGGSAITDYDIRYTSDNGATWTEWSAGTTITGAPVTITGLTNGTTYKVSIRATNSSGTSAWSGSSWYGAAPSTKPATPTLHVFAGRGHCQFQDCLGRLLGGEAIEVGFKGVSSNGGDKVLYRVQWQKDGDTDWKSWYTYEKITEPWSWYTITGLEQGETYNLRLAACNSLGCSFSSEVEAVPHAVPGRPTNVRASWELDTTDSLYKINIVWSNPTETGGKDLTRYRISYCTGSTCAQTWSYSNGGWTDVDGSSSATVHTALVSNSGQNAARPAYSITVWAGNSLGFGRSSAIGTTQNNCTSNCS